MCWRHFQITMNQREFISFEHHIFDGREIQTGWGVLVV